jgi:4-hydroxybenzoate polyprenyltransferase
MLKSAFNYFLYTSVFISLCAIVMVAQTNFLFQLDYGKKAFYAFVFSATICSYNFHWYLTPFPASDPASGRSSWNHRHRKLVFVLFMAGLVASVIFGWPLREHWLAISVGIVATFFYTAPKIPFSSFNKLKKFAFGKTIFLSFIWMYVTTALPILVSGTKWDVSHTLFCCSRFFLIYPICILFDYRDREGDLKQGIKSMITIFDEKNITRLFLLSMLIFYLSTLALYFYGFSALSISNLLIPGMVILAIYRYSKKHFGDYLYYFFLDGMMMASSLFTLFLRI